MRALERGVDAATDLAAGLSGAVLGVMILFYWIEVVSRYFFGAPTVLTSLAPHMVLVAVMLMLPAVTRAGGHVAMSFLFEIVPPAAGRALAAGLALLSAAVCSFTAWLSLVETLRQLRRGVVSMDQLMFPLWWVSAFLIFGFTLSALHFLRHALRGAPVPNHEEGH